MKESGGDDRDRDREWKHEQDVKLTVAASAPQVDVRQADMGRRRKGRRWTRRRLLRHGGDELY